MKLFNVACEIMIDAKSADDAMEKVRYFLSGDYDVDINFLVHSAEADESFEDIDALRSHQMKTQTDTQYLCARCGYPRSEHPSGKCAAFAVGV